MKRHLTKRHLKLFTMVLALILIITTSACEFSGDHIDEIEDEPMELTFFYPVQVDGPLANFIEIMAEEFTEENPNITINPVYTGNYSDMAIKLEESKKAGNPPDFFVNVASKRFTMVDKGMVEPLNELIAQDGGRSYINGFVDEFMKDTYVDDKIYGIPFQRSTEILYYNKNAFQEAGLDPDRPPNNWAELVSFSKKLMKEDDQGNTVRWGVGLPLNIGAAQWTFGAFAMQNRKTDGNIMSDDGKEVYFDTPENVEVLQLWVDLQNRHKVMPEGITQWDDLPKDFLKGKYGMIYHTTGNLTNIFKNADFEFGTAILPANKRFGSAVGGADFYISKGISKERQEAAWKFIRFATTTNQVADWSVNTGYVATRNDAHKTQLLETYYEELPQAKVGAKQIVYSKPELATYESDRIWKILDINMQLAINGKITPAKALKNAQDEADKVLAKYK